MNGADKYSRTGGKSLERRANRVIVRLLGPKIARCWGILAVCGDLRVVLIAESRIAAE